MIALAVFLAFINVLSFVLLVALRTRDRRPQFPIVFRSTPENLLIGLRSIIDAPKVRVQPVDMSRYPNGVIRPAVGDFGESCTEVDVKDWPVVRALELDIYNCYWHTRTGEYLPAGITPEEEAEEADRIRAEAKQAQYLAGLKQAADLRERPEMARVRTPLSPFDPSALYVTPSQLRNMTMKDYAEARARHLSQLAEAATAQRAVSDSTGGFIAALFGEHASEQLVEGVRMTATGFIDRSARYEPDPSSAIPGAVRKVQPPWGQDVEDRLIESGMSPPAENVVSWDETYGSDYFWFKATYLDGSVYRATMSHGMLSVEAGPRGRQAC